MAHKIIITIRGGEAFIDRERTIYPPCVKDVVIRDYDLEEFNKEDEDAEFDAAFGNLPEPTTEVITITFYGDK